MLTFKIFILIINVFLHFYLIYCVKNKYNFFTYKCYFFKQLLLEFHTRKKCFYQFIIGSFIHDIIDHFYCKETQRQSVRRSETQSYLITVNTAQLLFKGTSANQEAEGESDVTVGVAFVSVHACMQTAAFSTGNRPVYLQSVSPARVRRPLVAELVSAALKHDA